jgi:tetratricopeptide (TPR) repeat protein
VAAAGALGDLAECANVHLLTARAQPAAGDTRTKVDALRMKLWDAKALDDLGKYPEAIAVAKPIVDEARALAYRPLEAEALYQLGELQRRVGEFDASAATLDQAVVVATASRHDQIAARASIRRALVIGVEKGRYDEGRVLIQHARAAIERLGGDPRLEAMLAGDFGVLLRKQGNYDESLAQFDRAIELGTSTFGESHPDIAAWWNSSGLTLIEAGRFEEARTRLMRALKIWETAFGASHPAVGFVYGNLGLERIRSDQFEEAIVLGTRSLEIIEASLGGDSYRMISVLLLLGDSHRALGHHREAIADLERASALQAKHRPADHPSSANTLASLGTAYVANGEAARGIPLLEKALAILERVASADPSGAAEVKFALAKGKLALGERVAARKLATAAREGYTAAGPKGARDVAEVDAWLVDHAKPRRKKR